MSIVTGYVIYYFIIQEEIMKFKTRLKVTFATIVFLPLLLTALAFCVIGVYLINAQPGVSVQNLDFAMISEPDRKSVV